MEYKFNLKQNVFENDHRNDFENSMKFFKIRWNWVNKMKIIELDENFYRLDEID